ncbi:MAG: hypothetical protein V3W32_05850 [Gemmatimonadota bacterium]
MGWADAVGPETLTEPAAGSGKYMAAGISANPRETLAFIFERTDTPTESWGVEIYAGLADGTWGAVPVSSRRWEAANPEGNIAVTGYPWYIARALNVDASPVDVVVVNVTYRKDRVSL